MATDRDLIRIEMTRQQALEQGLLTCKCGHPGNNHFSFDQMPCAHCKCKYYDEVARRGKIIAVGGTRRKRASKRTR